jgi:hypothetical protein
MTNSVFWDVTSVALDRTDISEKPITSIIRVEIFIELRTLAVTRYPKRRHSSYRNIFQLQSASFWMRGELILDAVSSQKRNMN